MYSEHITYTKRMYTNYVLKQTHKQKHMTLSMLFPYKEIHRDPTLKGRVYQTLCFLYMAISHLFRCKDSTQARLLHNLL